MNEASIRAHVVVNGVDYEVEIEGAKASTVSKPQVSLAPKSGQQRRDHSLGWPLARASLPRPSDVQSSVKMPAAGHRVEREGGWRYRGRTDARRLTMKMENNIDADRAGVVKQILVQQALRSWGRRRLIIIG